MRTRGYAIGISTNDRVVILMILVQEVRWALGADDEIVGLHDDKTFDCSCVELEQAHLAICLHVEFVHCYSMRQDLFRVKRGPFCCHHSTSNLPQELMRVSVRARQEQLE